MKLQNFIYKTVGKVQWRDGVPYTTNTLFLIALRK